MNNKTETVPLINSWIFRLSTILSVLAFSIPFLISGPQFITGSVVNALLFIASAKQVQRNLYLISFLPSLGAVSNGLLFGKFTPYLLFFIPLICFGNMALILSFQKVEQHLNFPLNIIVPSLLKVSILYISATLLVGNHIVPKIFLSSMGIIQLYTALIGGTMVFILYRISKSKI